MAIFEVFTIAIIVLSLMLARSSKKKGHLPKKKPKTEKPTKKNILDNTPSTEEARIMLKKYFKPKKSSEKNKLDNTSPKKVDYSYLKSSNQPRKPSKKKKSDIEKIISCPECKTKQRNKDALYCFSCGQELNRKEMIDVKECPRCTHQYNLSYNFCEIDGTELKNKTVEVGSDIAMPMRWYKFITYFQIPLGGIGYLVWALVVEDFILLISPIIASIQIYGLHCKTKWSWKLLIFNWVLYSIVESISRWEITGNPFVLIVGPIIVNAIVTYPHYIYFNKRKHLFVN